MRKSRRNRHRTKPVAGWQPGGTCTLAVENGSLVVQSTGGDPFFSYQLPKAVSQQTLILRFAMTSESSGSGQVFWHEQGVAPAFFRDRSVGFDAIHDGESHEYADRVFAGRSRAGRQDRSFARARSNAAIQHPADRWRWQCLASMEILARQAFGPGGTEA